MFHGMFYVEQFLGHGFLQSMSSKFGGKRLLSGRSICTEFVEFVPCFRLPDFYCQKAIVRVMVRLTGEQRKARDAALAEWLVSQNPGAALRREMIAARVHAGLTQGQLARRMGTTQSVIARLEIGGRSPSIQTLRRLAEATGSRLVVRLEAK